MTWHDKLAFAGILVGFIGFMMFLAGLGYMMQARNQAMAHYRASIQQAREELLKR